MAIQTTIEEAERGAAHLVALLETCEEGIISVDLEGIVQTWSRGAERLLGYNPDEVLGEPLERFFGTQNGEQFEGISLYEATLRRKDGEPVCLSVKRVPIRRPDGQTIGASLVVESRDEIDQERARQRLEESERIFRATFDNAAVGIAHIGLDGRWLRFNERLREITGFEREELLTLTSQAITHPDDVPADLHLSHGLLEGRHRPFQMEKRYIRKRGDVAWVHLSASLVCNASGESQFFVVVVQDIGERKAAELALRESEQRYRLALEGGELGTWTFDASTREVQLDARAREILALPAQGDIDSGAVERRVHPDDLAHATARFRNSIKTGERYEIDHRIVSPDGEVRWVRARGIVVPAKDRVSGTRLVGVVNDATPQKRAEEALENASRRKDDYLAMLSHELRNPLSAIRVAGELIKRESKRNGGEALAKASGVLERQSTHMAKLLDGLLDVSRVTRGKLSIERQTIELGPVIRNVVEDRAADADARGVSLSVSMDENAERTVLHADPARLTQVFDNLVANALKFTEEGGRVVVEAVKERDEVVVTVRDTGIGFTPELAGLLFEVFQQGPQDLSRKAGGLGLGLAFSRRLVDLHGGTIHAHSAGEGKGAEFIVRLPIPQSQSIGDSDGRDSDQHPEGTLRILLVEDNEDSAQMLCEVLEDWGHEVVVAHRGQEGVDKALLEQPDLIFCDIGLPEGMTGFDVAEKLAHDPRTNHIRLVALSGYGRPQDKARAREAGFDAHLTKPVDLDAISRTVDQTLQIRAEARI